MTYMPIRNQVPIEIEPQIFDNIYLHDLQMYIVPPSGYIYLEELQQWCVDRLRVLKLIEQISMQNYKESPKHCVAILTKKLEENGFHNFAKLVNSSGYKSQGNTQQYLRRNDCMSHFILKSAFSFEYEKKQWFFKQEVRLFKWRFSALDTEGVEAFCCMNGFQYTPISEKEKQKIKRELEISCDVENVDDMKFYKVHFTNVINLIAKRKIFLKDSIAYVPRTEMCSLILPEFKRKLNKGFVKSREVASNLYGDERMAKIFSVLPSCVSTQYFKFGKYRQVSINELDELSRTSYPLCMKMLHEALRTKHHLTDGGRVQYCLFLKGIGLRFNDAFKFWKDEFTKKVDETTFHKKYAYNVRHLYGQEGKRANYEPFHCLKILNFTVGLRDNHGCPFKCMTSDILKKVLSKCGMVQSDIESVIKFSKEGSYLQACKKYYEITHNCITEDTFDHPNMYFINSRKNFENMYSDTED